MRWFEEYKSDWMGSESEPSGSSPSEIAEIAAIVLDGRAMVRFVHDFFLSQKDFSDFLGVAESTVAGWMKSESFPDYAKRATLAAYYANKYFRQLRGVKSDAARPKVVKDGEGYLIVKFDTDEAGVSIGEIIARDVPTERTALVLAGSLRAWELLEDAEEIIDQEIEGRGPDGEWLVDLKEEIVTERARAFHHQKLVELRQTYASEQAELEKLAEKLAENLSIYPDAGSVSTKLSERDEEIE